MKKLLLAVALFAGLAVLSGCCEKKAPVCPPAPCVQPAPCPTPVQCPPPAPVVRPAPPPVAVQCPPANYAPRGYYYVVR